MSVFDELITDRTQADVTNLRPKAYIAYTDLNRIEEACKLLAEYFKIEIVTKTDWAMTDFRTETDMARIRGNLQALKEAFYVRPTTPAVPQVIRYQTVTEANDIEQILKDLYELYNSVDRSSPRFAFKLGAKTLGDRR